MAKKRMLEEIKNGKDLEFTAVTREESANSE